MIHLVSLLLIAAQDGPNADLAAALRGKVPRARLDAMKTIAVSPAAVDRLTMQALVECTADPSIAIRKQALQTIGEIGPRAREWGGGPKLGEAVAKAFRDPDPVVRRASVWAYGQIGIDNREELDVLAAVFKDKSRRDAGYALQALGEYMHEQTPKEWRLAMEDRMAELLADSDERVQKVAAEQLLAAGPETLGVLVKTLDNPKRDARVWAALVLGELGPAARPGDRSPPRALSAKSPRSIARSSRPQSARSCHEHDDCDHSRPRSRRIRRTGLLLPRPPRADHREHAGADDPRTHPRRDPVDDPAAGRDRVSLHRAEAHGDDVVRFRSKLPHYFTPFQAFVLSSTEDERRKFPIEIGLLILEREAQYRSNAPTPAGLFVFQFETLSRNRLGYDEGLARMKGDGFYDPDWREFLELVRRQIGVVDFADLVYLRSEMYVREQRRTDRTYEPPVPVLFGEKEGKIAKANRGRDPLYLFAALQRQLGYPEVPRARPKDDPATQILHLNEKLRQVEQRLKLLEGEARGRIDFSEFLAKPDLLRPDDDE